MGSLVPTSKQLLHLAHWSLLGSSQIFFLWGFQLLVYHAQLIYILFSAVNNSPYVLYTFFAILDRYMNVRCWWCTHHFVCSSLSSEILTFCNLVSKISSRCYSMKHYFREDNTFLSLKFHLQEQLTTYVQPWCIHSWNTKEHTVTTRDWYTV